MELESSQDVVRGSTKLLTEKLALSRELTSSQPELEHLRSQAALHQTILAERLSLQRKVSSLQVELETERRCVKRTIAKENKLQQADAKIVAQIEKLQSDLTWERKERQNAEQDLKRVSAEWESRLITAESRSDGFRDKLQATKDFLRKTQVELERMRSLKNRVSGLEGASIKMPPNRRKRFPGLMDEDSMIGTPGGGPAAKKGRKASSMVGEKSTFSITPFLNRICIAPESSSSPAQKQSRMEQSPALIEREIAGSNIPATSASEKLEYSHKASKFGQSTPGPDNKFKYNSNPALAGKATIAPRLEQVTEEENDQHKPETSPTPPPKGQGSVVNATSRAHVKKTKRKLLGGTVGKTLFDEESEDGCNNTGVHGGSRQFEVGSKLAPRTSTVTFRPISPLKRGKNS